MVVFISIAVAAAIGMFVFWLLRAGRMEYANRAAQLKAVNSIPSGDAKARAMSLLQNPQEFFVCASGQPDPGQVEKLASGLREVFEQFESIEPLPRGRQRLDRRLIGQPPKRPDFVLVGRGMEGSDVEFDLGVLDGDEAIYVLYAAEPPDLSFGVYTSVYHWIIAAASDM